MSDEPKFTIELMCCDDVMLNEIAQGCNQRQIAQTYALALRSSYPTDWRKVNEAIIARWSTSGLVRIKEMAWSGKCFDEPKRNTKTSRAAADRTKA